MHYKKLRNICKNTATFPSTMSVQPSVAGVSSFTLDVRDKRQLFHQINLVTFIRDVKPENYLECVVWTDLELEAFCIYQIQSRQWGIVDLVQKCMINVSQQYTELNCLLLPHVKWKFKPCLSTIYMHLNNAYDKHIVSFLCVKWTRKIYCLSFPSRYSLLRHHVTIIMSKTHACIILVLII